MSITSPCISVCVTDPTSDLCYGCARTTSEIKKWSSFSDEEKLANIEKVIDTFSGKGTTVVDSGQSVGQAQSINLNQQPLDLGNVQAKAYQAEYLKPSTVHDDRIALLYDNLKKYNLI